MGWSNWEKIIDRLVNSFGSHSHFYETTYFRTYRDAGSHNVTCEIYYELKYTHDQGLSGTYGYPIGVRVRFNNTDENGFSDWTRISEGGTWSNGALVGTASWSYTISKDSGQVAVLTDSNNQTTWGFDHPRSDQCWPYIQSYIPNSYWNDINAYQPGQSTGGTQNGLKFDLATSDGGRWYNLTNEPEGFTKTEGTTATISNIRAQEVNAGSHYTRNNVTNTDASSFSWTFSQANWVCELFSDWNTWYIDYYGNGATGGSTGRSTHTYNTAKNLTSNGYYRTNYDFRGWSTSSTATTPTYSNGQSVSNLTTANNGVVNLYAVWRATKPSNVQAYTTARSYDYMDVEVSYTGVEISNITLYYKKSTDSSYTSVNMGTSTSTRISNLDMDTNYDLYCTVTNPGGSTSSSVLTTSTLLNALGITQPVVTNLLPFSCTVSAEGSLPVVRTLQYRFSNDGGATWTAYQASNSYDWTGLSEETTYNFGVMVKAIHQGVDSTDMTVDDYVTATTPADQAKIRIKDNGEWLKGKMWYKTNGEWVKAKKVYIKKNGEWVIGYNYENN